MISSSGREVSASIAYGKLSSKDMTLAGRLCYTGQGVMIRWRRDYILLLVVALIIFITWQASSIRKASKPKTLITTTGKEIPVPVARPRPALIVEPSPLSRQHRGDTRNSTWRPPVYDGIGIPKIIHQTWKTENLDPLTVERVATWKVLNPNHVYKLWTDAEVEDFVYEFYPHVIETWARLPRPVYKADLFRYLVLHKYGGTYADVDTECLKPIDVWNDGQKAAAIVGIEIDAFDENGSWRSIIPRGLQFTQWTISSIPNHPLLSRVVNRSLTRIADSTFQELLHADSLEVQELTGPAIWTDSVYLHTHDLGSRDPRRDYKHLVIPQLVGRDEAHEHDNLLLLPITGFNPTCYGMKAQGPCHSSALVLHRFQGTWRPPPPGPVGRTWSPPIIDTRPVHLIPGDIVVAWLTEAARYDPLGFGFFEVSQHLTLGKYAVLQKMYAYQLEETSPGTWYRKDPQDEKEVCQDRLLLNRRGMFYVIDESLEMKELASKGDVAQPSLHETDPNLPPVPDAEPEIDERFQSPRIRRPLQQPAEEVPPRGSNVIQPRMNAAIPSPVANTPIIAKRETTKPPPYHPSLYTIKNGNKQNYYNSSFNNNMDTHPSVFREAINKSPQLKATSMSLDAAAINAQQQIESKQADLYPAVAKAIENQGNPALVAALHKVEKEASGRNVTCDKCGHTMNV
ncbi:hypothetical protein SmJEL517_g01327 [Synchytrium microbalum]|uniref:Alpha 1,4-glycosyltransferase domain-containing protein n=1 Tax=Synchytrium microbalum TaxID=1806994 RepID=A0A507C6I3_9FUNG|nr:uncharacterized protein SmJEL517_g01327 [Synchytrium microbalum]TPX36647.1 hypothetical protein SmJEL517_g01327 [Synchytrium microbalum]